MGGTTHRCPVLSGAEQVCKALARRAPPHTHTGFGDTVGSHGMGTVDAEGLSGLQVGGRAVNPPALPHRCCTAWQCHRTPHVTAAGLMWLSSRLALLPGRFLCTEQVEMGADILHRARLTCPKLAQQFLGLSSTCPSPPSLCPGVGCRKEAAGGCSAMGCLGMGMEQAGSRAGCTQPRVRVHACPLKAHASCVPGVPLKMY